MSLKINFSTIDDISRRALSDYFFAVSCAAEISVSMKDKIKTCDEDILKAKSALDVNSNANTLAAYNAALRVKAAMKRSIAKEIKEAKDLKDSALALIPDSLYEVYLSMGESETTHSALKKLYMDILESMGITVTTITQLNHTVDWIHSRMEDAVKSGTKNLMKFGNPMSTYSMYQLKCSFMGVLIELFVDKNVCAFDWDTEDRPVLVWADF